MKLRYIRVGNLPPLEDVAITFGHEPAFGRECAINFIVGVNGSGKSRLLQTLVDVLLHLEVQRLPAYPITLAYDLGSAPDIRTIYLQHPGDNAANAVLVHLDCIPRGARWGELEEVDWNEPAQSPYKVVACYKGNELPGRGSIGYYLPSVLLAYTSGATASWEGLFAARRSDEQNILSAITSMSAEEMNMEQRPANWNKLKEAQLLGEQGFEMLSDESQSGGGSQSFTTHSIGLFVPQESLRLALTAVALDQSVREFRDEMPTEQAEKDFIGRINESVQEGRRMSGLRGVLNEVDWLWPVTIGLRLSFQPGRLTRKRRDELRRLYPLASSIVRDPEIQETDANTGRGRWLFFDLRRPVENRESRDNSTAAALMEALSLDARPTPLSIFTLLRQWQQEGLLEEVSITLRKRNLGDLLPYEWLSDGERVFLGRMALFHLLRGDGNHAIDDALILLDEPETHFNDVWKREIVDIIEDSLGSVASNVVITTHSSIALTDVFDNEITLLRKRSSDGQVKARRAPVQSFGASPGEIMREIFGASDYIGKRAAKFLDMVLAAAANPDLLEEIWRLEGDEQITKQSEAFRQLRELIRSSVEARSHDYGTDEQMDQRLFNLLDSLKQYSLKGVAQERSSVAGALDSLENRLGAGYHQFEIRRRLQALRERTRNDSSD